MTKKSKPPKVSECEKEQVRARRLVGHDFGIKLDEFKRERLAVGTAEAEREYEIATGGKSVRVRNIDPLKGIGSLTERHREAGHKYREDFEYSAREGLRTGAYQEHVDGGRLGGNVNIKLMEGHYALSSARQAVGYPEIAAVLDAVCGMHMSLSDVAKVEGCVRDIPAQLLRMGLDRLTVHYGIVSHPKRLDR